MDSRASVAEPLVVGTHPMLGGEGQGVTEDLSAFVRGLSRISNVTSPLEALNMAKTEWLRSYEHWIGISKYVLSVLGELFKTSPWIIMVKLKCWALCTGSIAGGFLSSSVSISTAHCDGFPVLGWHSCSATPTRRTAPHMSEKELLVCGHAIREQAYVLRV